MKQYEKPDEGLQNGSSSEPENPPQSSSEPRSRNPFYALTFPNYRLFFIGQSVSVIGTWMQIVAQNWLVWELTGMAKWLGIVNGANAIPYILFSMWGGKVADRYPRRDILVVTQIVAMLLAGVLTLLTLSLWIPIQPWHIAVLAGFSGIMNAFNLPAQQAFVTDIIDEKEALGNAIALNSLRFNSARFVGPMLAGLVLVKWGAGACFLLNAISFAAVILSLLKMQLPPFIPHNRDLSMREGMIYILNHRPTLRNVILMAAGAMFVWSGSTLFPVIATHFKLRERGYSWMVSANGIGAMLCGFLLASVFEVIPTRTRIYFGAVLFGSALFLVSVATSFTAVLGLLMVSGFGMILCAASSNTSVQKGVPEHLRGRVMAVYSLAFQGVMPFGGLMVGYMADRLSAPIALRINASIFLVTTLVLFAWSQRERVSYNVSES